MGGRSIWVREVEGVVWGIGDVLDPTAEDACSGADELGAAVGLADLDQVDAVHRVAGEFGEFGEAECLAFAELTDLRAVGLQGSHGVGSASGVVGRLVAGGQFEFAFGLGGELVGGFEDVGEVGEGDVGVGAVR